VVVAAEVCFIYPFPLFSLIVVQVVTAPVVEEVEAEADEVVAVGAEVGAATTEVDTAVVAVEGTVGGEEDVIGGELRSISVIRLILQHWPRFGPVF